MVALQAMRAGGDADLGTSLAEIAAEAGRAILALAAEGVDIERKRDASPVTEADRRAEEIILERLVRLAPQIPVIAEEQASAGRVPDVGEHFFLVDPLDGTKEFIRGSGEYTVNIAVIEGGRPVAGVIHAPALGMIAIADAAGAREAALQGGDLAGAEWRKLRTRQVPETGMVAVASRSHRDAQTDAFLARRGINDIRSAGSSLKFCVLARGDADVYPRFGRTMEWDIAAGHAILAAAGGAVLSDEGGDLHYGKRERGYDNPSFVAWGRRPAGT